MDFTEVELMKNVLTGEIDLADPRVEAARANPEFARELDEMLGVVGGLEERNVLEEARSLDAVPGEEQVAGLVRERLLPKRRGHLLQVLAAIAALLFVVVLVRSRTDVSEEPQIYLGSGELTCLAPVGGDATFLVFSWSHDADAGYYEVEVYDTEGVDVEGGRSGKLSGVREWRPQADAVERWPDEIEWIVRWVGPDGHESVLAPGSASR